MHEAAMTSERDEYTPRLNAVPWSRQGPASANVNGAPCARTTAKRRTSHYFPHHHARARAFRCGEDDLRLPVDTDASQASAGSEMCCALVRGGHTHGVRTA